MTTQQWQDPGSASEQAFSSPHLEILKAPFFQLGFCFQRPTQLSCYLALTAFGFLPWAESAWGTFFLGQVYPDPPMRTGAASLKMGLGCARPAAYLAFFVWLSPGLVLHSCCILVLAPGSGLHVKSVASEISLWHQDHPGSGLVFEQPWARRLFCVLAPLLILWQTLWLQTWTFEWLILDSQPLRVCGLNLLVRLYI